MRYARLVLLALLLLAAQPASPPPARLMVPKSVRERRGGEDLPLPPSIFDDPQLSAALGPLQPRVGAWVEYAIRTRGKGGVRARFSIVPPERSDGRYWLEVNAISQDVPPASVKLLLHGDTLSRRQVERMFLLLTGQAPLEIPVDELPADGDAAAKKAAPASRVRRGPPSTVQVRAGTYRDAETLRAGEVRIWRSSQVPLWGLVKAQSPSQTLELTASGLTGAQSVFPPGWGDEPAQGTGSESTK